jgi:hypothetical protein
MRTSFSRHFLAALSACLFLACSPMLVRAATLVQSITADDHNTFFPGQSVTTPGGGPFNTISFNFFDGVGNPTAFGNLFILTQEYLGTPANLSTLTPGFLTKSTGISAGVYQFDSSVTLAPNTHYFFYATSSFDINFSSPNPYAGGSFYVAGGPFQKIPESDADFRLTGQQIPLGQPVPLPSALSLGLTLLPAAMLVRRFRRRIV